MTLACFRYVSRISSLFVGFWPSLAAFVSSVKLEHSVRQGETRNGLSSPRPCTNRTAPRFAVRTRPQQPPVRVRKTLVPVLEASDAFAVWARPAYFTWLRTTQTPRHFDAGASGSNKMGLVARDQRARQAISPASWRLAVPKRLNNITCRYLNNLKSERTNSRSRSCGTGNRGALGTSFRDIVRHPGKARKTLITPMVKPVQISDFLRPVGSASESPLPIWLIHLPDWRASRLFQFNNPALRRPSASRSPSSFCLKGSRLK